MAEQCAVGTCAGCIACCLPTCCSEDRGWFSPIDCLCMPTYPVHRKGAVLVTGASRGLGKEMALLLAASGFTVFGNVRKEADAKALKQEMGESVIPVLMDQTQAEQVAEAYRFVSKELAERRLPMVGLVCNAGITEMGPVEGLDFSLFKSLMDTNVMGSMLVIKTFLPCLRKAKGRIVVLGAPDMPLPQYTYKTAANGALLGMTRALRVELHGVGVSVSLVMPAATGGNMVKTMPEKVRGHRQKMSEEVQQTYPEPKLIKRMADAKFQGLSTSWATCAVKHALTSRFPKTRYTTTPVGTWLYFLSSCCPDRVLEKLIVRICG